MVNSKYNTHQKIELMGFNLEKGLLFFQIIWLY